MNVLYIVSVFCGCKVRSPALREGHTLQG